MAVTLIHYDFSETDGKKRMEYGIDSASDVSSLPTDNDIAPWSTALDGATKDAYYFTGTEWAKIGG